MIKTDFDIIIKQKKILFYIRGKYNFYLINNIVKSNPDYYFYFISNALQKDEYIKSELYSLPNTVFIENLNVLNYKLHMFGLFITINSATSSAYNFSLKFSQVLNRFNIKTIELQHGLFQLGIDYFHNPNKTYFYNDSLQNNIVADTFLSFVPYDKIENSICIGYPPYTQTQNTNYLNGAYTLILTNLHWKSYTDIERYNFYQFIVRLSYDNPNRLFILRQHPAEKLNENCQKIYKNVLENFSADQINIVSENEIFDDINTEELIAKSKNVISTVSTTLLDCEINKKNTYIYECDTSRLLIKKISSCKTFSSYEELISIFDKKATIETGRLKLYDNSVFRKVVGKNYYVPKFDKTTYLEIIKDFKKDSK